MNKDIEIINIIEFINQVSNIHNISEDDVVNYLKDTKYSDLIEKYIQYKKKFDLYFNLIKLPYDILKKIMIDNLNPLDTIYLCSINKEFKDKICTKKFWPYYIKERYEINVKNTFDKTDLIKLIKDYKFLRDDLTRPKYSDLLKAVNFNDVVVVQILLKDKDIDPSEDNNNAFMMASDKGYYEVTRLLLDDPRVDPTIQGNEAIQSASGKGDYKITKLLLNWRGPSDSQGRIKRVDPSVNHNHAIIFASQGGHTSIVKLLLADDRVDPSDQNNEAIIRASIYGHTSVVKLLLNWRGHLGSKGDLKIKSVDPTDKNNEAIKRAVNYGHTSVVKLLLKDPRIDPSVDDNILIISASQNGYSSIVELLLNDPRVDPSDKNNEALRLARKYRRTEVIKLLLKDKRVTSR